MIDTILLSMAPQDWLRLLTAVHYAGIATSLLAVLISDIVAFTLLTREGPKPNQWLLHILHAAVMIGLCLLWLSGTAIAITKYTLATLPPKLIFKLGAAVLLSINALFIQSLLMPFLSRPRPLARNLTTLEITKVIFIASLSVACWFSITAVAFVKPLHAFSAEMLYAGLAAVFTIAAACLTAIIWHARAQAHVRRRTTTLRSPSPLTSSSGTLDATAAKIIAWPKTSRAAARATAPGKATEPRAKPNAERHTNFSAAALSCRRAITGVAVASFFTNMLMLTGPIFMLQVYDRVLTSKSLPTLASLFAFCLGLFAFMGLIDWLRSRLLVRIGLRFDRALAQQVFDRSLDVSDAAERARTQQLHEDVRQVRQFVSGSGATALLDMPWAPAYFAIIWLFHWQLGMVALAGATILIVLSLLNELSTRRWVSALASHSAECAQLLEAGRRNSETLQAMGMAQRYSHRWLKEHSAELLIQTKAADVSGLLLALSKLSRLVLQAAMLGVGAYLVIGNEASPGVMIAASIIMSRALAPIEQAIAQWRGFVAARQGVRRLAKALDQPNDADGRMSMPPPQARISVENLFAGAIGTRDPILKGLNFRLEPGDAVGVLGPSGGGKSTLARVLVGAWPALRGDVRLAGATFDQWPPQQLGRHVGYLPQHAELFDGTVADNICRFDTEARPEDIYAAAKIANVHEMILKLPDGYATKVGDRGITLSGGQRQRIALARALFGNPVLVVLDEPNSNLDAEGEAALAEAILALRNAGQCVVVMAHRRKALEHANLLLVLKEGRQVAFGPKDEILKRARRPIQIKEPAAHAV